MTKKQKRATVGILVGGIMDDFTRIICKGVMKAAKRKNVNLVFFPAKYLDRDVSDNRDLRYEYQYGTILSYARKQNLDAIVAAAGCIRCFSTSERMLEGVILCEMMESIFESREFLVNHLSSAAKMIDQLRSNQKIQQEHMFWSRTAR